MKSTAEGAKEILLYSYFRSSASWRIRNVLNLKKIPYELKIVNLLAGEEKSQEYCKVNPSARVPTLFIDGIYIPESMVIAEYLEETRPEIPLLPKDPAKRAYVRRICEIVNSGIQPLQNLMVIKKLETENKVDPVEWSLFFINKGLVAIEQTLHEHAGKYCLEDQITLADTFLVPQVQGAVDRFKLDLTPYPTITKVLNNLLQLDEFQRALPKNQPDFPAPKPQQFMLVAMQLKFVNVLEINGIHESVCEV